MLRRRRGHSVPCRGLFAAHHPSSLQSCTGTVPQAILGGHGPVRAPLLSSAGHHPAVHGHPVAARPPLHRPFTQHAALDDHALTQQRRGQASRQEGPSGRDKARYESMADGSTGDQQALGEPPDLRPSMDFVHNLIEHVAVPELSDEQRQLTDRQRFQKTLDKYGPRGPGGAIEKSMAQARREMIEAQQDVDGLPWEVRWRRALIPTHEEVIQEVRDRFELFVLDPIEREQLWYLHWKDRDYIMTPDRLVWPQGFTDYLDHYDEHGRRRVLPGDQRWSSTSWKHLSDVKYRDRMFLIDSQERKFLHETMESEESVLARDAGRIDEISNVTQSMASGVLDMNPDEMYQALSGTAEPRVVAETKQKLASYQAITTSKIGTTLKATDLDPVSLLPKSQGQERLASGLTVEEATAVLAGANELDDRFNRKAALAPSEGQNPIMAAARDSLALSKLAGDEPILAARVERRIEKIHQARGQVQSMQERMRAMLAEEEAEMAAATAAATIDVPTAPADDPQLTSGEASPSKVVPSASSTASAAAPQTTAATNESPAAKASKREAIAPSMPTSSSGFLSVEARPAHCEPDIPRELFTADTVSPSMSTSATGRGSSSVGGEGSSDTNGSAVVSGSSQMPEWYVQSVIQTEPPIFHYRLIDDPISNNPLRPEDLHEKPKTAKTLMSADEATMGENVFDTTKRARHDHVPELSKGAFKPLPLYSEAAAKKAAEEKQLALEAANGSGAAKNAVTLRDQRLERKKIAKSTFDADIMLPDLPWESDSISDPYRGVAEVDAVPFQRDVALATWNTFKDFLSQRMADAMNVSNGGTEEQCEAVFRDAIRKLQEGDVGGNIPATIHPKQLECIRIAFEAQMRRYYSDFLETIQNRRGDRDAAKERSEELSRVASAQAKALGPSFLNFLSEMSILEVENAKKNPFHRGVLMIRNKKCDPLAKPFFEWIENSLNPFRAMAVEQMDQIKLHQDLLDRQLNTARSRCPGHIHEVPMQERGAVVGGLFHYCKGLIHYFAGIHHLELFRRHADTRFRSGAEDEFKSANEHFQGGYNAGKSVVTAPLPNAEPFYDYVPSDFPSSDVSPIQLEMDGDLETAEQHWTTGSVHRWYPLQDETEHVWYMERRGQFTNMFDASERCLEALNKKTHPSIHPFPDRAHKWLEGAPLTQETAEHLWLRHMGDVHNEHADINFRHLRNETALNLREKAVNFYYLAIQQAREKLPRSWSAPLLTQAKYLCKAYDPLPQQQQQDPQQLEDASKAAAEYVQKHLKDVEDTIDALYALSPRPRHWVDPLTELPIRVALISYNAPAYSDLIFSTANRVSSAFVSLADLELAMTLKANSQDTSHIKGLAAFDAALEEIVEQLYRQKIRRWMAQEVEGSDAHTMLTHLLYRFRARPRTAEDAERHWQTYQKTYNYIYSQTCLGTTKRGTDLIDEAVRTICWILYSGNDDHKKTLLALLKEAREKLTPTLDARELDRTILAVERNLKDPTSPKYVYQMQTMATALQGSTHPDAMRAAPTAKKEYRKLQARIARMKDGASSKPDPFAQPHGGGSVGDATSNLGGTAESGN